MHRLTVLILLLIGSALVFVGVPAQLHADDQPTTKLSKAEFDRLAKELHLKNQPWAKIPWKVSVTRARRLAAKEHKPIFLVVNTGNCLGWT
jgi:hypothetical protein